MLNHESINEIMTILERSIKGENTSPSLERKTTKNSLDTCEVTVNKIVRNLNNSTISTDNKVLHTGFKYLDDMALGLKNGKLIVLASRPALGKTSLALDIALNVCQKTDVANNASPVLYFTNDETIEDISLRLISKYSNISSSRLRKKILSPEDLTHIDNIVSEISNLPLFVDDENAGNINKIIEISKTKSREKPVALIIVDYLQLVRSTHPRPHDQDFSDAIIELKSLAKELECPVLVLSQLNRGTERREDKSPRISDLKDNGTLEELADVVMMLYRDEVYHPKTKEPNIAEVLVEKNRGGEVGMAKLIWNKRIRCFENLIPARLLEIENENNDEVKLISGNEK